MGDPNAPVLVGAAQLIQRDVDPQQALEPLAMLETVARAAAEDGGASERVLADADTIAVVDIAGWRAGDAPRQLASRIGAKPLRRYTTGIGGELPLVVANRIAGEIASGAARVALLVGCNNLKTLRRAHDQGVALDWTKGGDGDSQQIGTRERGSSEVEKRYGLATPPSVYPIFENALRARRGLGLDRHRASIGALMSRFSEVASKNPYAWFPTARSADEITAPSPTNRMIAFPYTKYLNAVIETDQAAGVLLMSAAAARAHGIREDRWVHWWGGAHATERAWYASERPDFAVCPALRAAASGALARAGVCEGDIDYIDFYSCFPVAVEMACEMLGIDETAPRGLTLTGGLPYAGGPANNYTLHSLATAVQRLRDDPGSKALVTGNGWYLTKHSALVLSSEAKPGAVETGGAADTPGSGTAIPIAEEASGRATVETYTVLYARDGAPERGIVIGRLDGGPRFIANTPDDRNALESFVAVENVGRAGRVEHRDGQNRFEPA
ncbi:MAG: acetyl-CoA acetyltransferase [Myxococcota bacterium]